MKYKITQVHAVMQCAVRAYGLRWHTMHICS